VNEPQASVVALAGFLRHRLATARPARGPRAATGAGAVASARQLALVIVGAAAPFAPTPQARARLLRQMHASGLLSDRELARTREILGAAR
jgi:hypothetical protein